MREALARILVALNAEARMMDETTKEKPEKPEPEKEPIGPPAVPKRRQGPVRIGRPVRRGSRRPTRRKARRGRRSR